MQLRTLISSHSRRRTAVHWHTNGTFAACLTAFLVVATATPCYAHSLPLILLGLGPISVLAPILSVVGCPALLVIVSIQAVVLCRFIPGAVFWGSLWRAAVILVAAKLVEVAPAFINPDALARDCSDPMWILIVTLMFVVGMGASAVLIRLLYRRVRPGVFRAIWLSWALESISVGGLYLSNIALLKAGILK